MDLRDFRYQGIMTPERCNIFGRIAQRTFIWYHLITESQAARRQLTQTHQRQLFLLAHQILHTSKLTSKCFKDERPEKASMLK